MKTRRKAELSVKPTLDEELTSSSGSGSDSNDDDEELSEISPSESSNDIPDVTVEPLNGDEVAHKKKRKRATDDNDDVEGRYLDRLAREEDVSRKRARAERKSPSNHSDPDLDDEPASNSDDDMEKDVSFEIPQHETVSKGKDEEELEKASRTVFLGNVSTQAIKSGTSKHALMDHLLSFLSDLPNNVPPHKIESLRFRSTAYSDSSLPKKAAFVKRELMDATTQSTNAYAVYSTALAAREAVKRLNGTVVLERHLRVDGVAHPRKTDHRRCVFVGNLGFVDDESLMRASEETEGISKKKKSKPPADVEEGLWRQFGNAGVVESVRVVRDKTTRVGKGFAYVQFKVCPIQLQAVSHAEENVGRKLGGKGTSF